MPAALSADTATPLGPAERKSSVAKRLKRFTDKILRKAPSSLLLSPTLPHPIVEAPMLPTCNRRIAAQAFSHVPASKRGQVLVMKQM